MAESRQRGLSEGDLRTSEPFEVFYRRSLAPMVRLAYLLTGGSAAAEELVQDAFIRVHARWDRIENPTAYLRRAVVNQTASHRRRVWLERRKGVEYRVEAVEQSVDELRDVVRALPYRQRAAVVLRYYADLPESEIAEALGCRVSAVKSLLYRAMNELREVVER